MSQVFMQVAIRLALLAAKAISPGDIEMNIPRNVGLGWSLQAKMDSNPAEDKKEYKTRRTVCVSANETPRSTSKILRRPLGISISSFGGARNYMLVNALATHV